MRPRVYGLLRLRGLLWPAIGVIAWTASALVGAQTPERSPKRAEAFYTDEQAIRGKYAFNRNCLFCHQMDPRLSTPDDLVQPLPRSFAGHFIERVVDGKVVYPSVFYLYSKLESMPAFDTNAISPQTRADITAYILQANGLPSGKDVLRADPDAMRMMMLNEPGFERVFNGKDFSGIKFVLGPNCLPQPEGCARTDPAGVVWVEKSTIACACNVHGIWYGEKKYLNFTLRFDFKFERPADWSDDADDTLFSGGSGYLIFMGEPAQGGYPRSIELEGRFRDLLSVFAIGGQAKYDYQPDLMRRAVKPLGQWNSIEIVARNNTVTAAVNGVVTTRISEHNYTQPGYIAFQTQGAKMYWRNIRIKPE